MLKLKPGVSFDGLQPEGDEIRQALEDVSALIGVDLTITCTTRDHSEADPHTHGYALDVRTLDLTPPQIVQVFRSAWKRLGTEQYTVRFEVKTKDEFAALPADLQEIASINDKATTRHIHIQFRKGLWQQLVAARNQALGTTT